MALHELLGEVFASFEGGAVGAGAYEPHFGHIGGEVVADACDQRVFIAHDDEFYSMFAAKSLDCRKIGRFERHVCSEGACASVAGSYKKV